MKISLQNTAGTSHLAIVGAIIVLSVVTFAGYKVVSTNKHKPATQVVQEVSAPATIANKEDLKQAESALASDDSTQSLNLDELNNDINSLL